MDAASLAPLTRMGATPDLATVWVGPWDLKDGWRDTDAQLDAIHRAGVTPAIHLYYWGDDISSKCLERGCWSDLHKVQKDQAGWQTLTQQLVEHVRARFDGRVVILLESEFNKGNVARYEPLDGYLAAKATFLHDQLPQAKVVMALGNWNPGDWGTWDRTAAASDYIGIQGLQTDPGASATYDQLFEALLDGARSADAKFGKPIMVQDFAFSSYSNKANPQALQAAALSRIFEGIQQLKTAGVQAMIYRSWRDSPKMDTANYHGEAERHWGLVPTGADSGTPAAKVWIDGVRAERGQPLVLAPPSMVGPHLPDAHRP